MAWLGRWLAVRRLRSGDPEARLAAVRKLGESPSRRSSGPLLEVLTQDCGFGDNDALLAATVSALDRIDADWRASAVGQETMRRLRAQLEAPEPPTRASAITALRHVGKSPEVADLLSEKLLDSDFYVRQRAARALAEVAGRAAIPSLIRATVADAYPEFDQALMKPAIGVYQSHLLRIDVGWARTPEARTTVPDLVSFLDKARWADWAAVKQREIESFYDANPQIMDSDFRRVDDVRKLWRTRRAAVRILGDIGDVRALEALVLALEDDEIPVRASAAKALGKIGDSRAIKPLRAALERSHDDPRSLREGGRYDGEDYHVSVRDAIEEALRHLTGKGSR